MEIYTNDGSNSAPNPEIFSDYRGNIFLGDNEFITLESEDQNTAGAYSFRYRVVLVNYPLNYVE